MNHSMDETVLEFPEVEMVKPPDPSGKLKEEREKQNKSLRLRNRFGRAVLQTMTQIVDVNEDVPKTEVTPAENESKPQNEPGTTDNEIPSINHNRVKEKTKKKYSLPNTRSRRTSTLNPGSENKSSHNNSRRGSSSNSGVKTRHSVASIGDTRKYSQGKSGPNIMSVIRLAKFRRMLGAREKKERSNSQISAMEDINEEEEVIELPVHPRFCATLSPEAQYSMLKCYQDKLIDNLHTTYTDNQEMLYRVKTPKKSIVSLQITGSSNEHETMPSQIQTRYGAWDKNISTRSSAMARLTPDSKDKLYNNGKLQSPREVPVEKQRLLSHRFQTAMDIIDKMKSTKGEMTTSPRILNKEIKPLQNYNSWSKVWAKDFQFQVTEKRS